MGWNKKKFKKEGVKMNYLDIGKERLEKVLFKEKAQHPEKVCEVLKSDIKKLISNYADIEEDANVTMQTTNEGFEFDIKVRVIRLKSFGSLPDIL